MASGDLEAISKHDWVEACRREAIIRTLAASEPGAVGEQAVRDAAETLGASRAGIYRMISRYRKTGRTSSLLPRTRGRPGGSRLLEREREALIAAEIETFYLTPQRPRLQDLVNRVREKCKAEGLIPPSWRTVRSRVESVDLKCRAARRKDQRMSAGLQATPGSLTTTLPLEIVQVDHTIVDVVVVDEQTRQPIGRPFLTLAVDVFSRMVAGFLLTLDPPSTVSVGLCLLHAVFDKSAWLADRDLAIPWPVAGLPATLGVDNGAEFHSRAFIRGCQEFGIAVDWRPPATPRFGAHIERLIGTQMGAVHLLPGTTFGSISARQGYKSDAQAQLTLRELERWLAAEILGKYHQRVHSALKRPPIAVWREHEGRTPLRMPEDRLGFWVSFLPGEHRMLRRDGIHLHSIRYWSPTLAGDLGRHCEPLLVKYDPRNLSRIFVCRPNGRYVEARYRQLGYPSITLWASNRSSKQSPSSAASRTRPRESRPRPGDPGLVGPRPPWPRMKTTA
jgi:putative transposase